MPEAALIDDLKKSLTLPDEELFGSDPKQALKQFAKVYHPDLWVGDPNEEALKKLYTELNNRYTNIGKPKAVISVDSEQYELTHHAGDGDFASIYTNDKFVIKASHGPAFNQYLKKEYETLIELKDKLKDYGTAKQRIAAPVKQFNIKNGALQTITVFDRLFADRINCVPMKNIKQLYPNGIDMADAAWIIRRLLETCEFLWSFGVVHGSITPDHVLLNQDTHAAILIGWTHSVKSGSVIQTASSEWRDFLAPEITEKRVATTETDVYMISKCLQWLVGDRINDPKFSQVKNLMYGCQMKSSAGRLNPTQVYTMFGKLLVDLYGNPKFRFLKLKE